MVRKAKAYLESHLARDVKSKKDFSKYIKWLRKTRENVGPLLGGTGDLVAQDILFTSVFTSGLSVPETRGKSGARKTILLVEIRCDNV